MFGVSARFECPCHNQIPGRSQMAIQRVQSVVITGFGALLGRVGPACRAITVGGILSVASAVGAQTPALPGQQMSGPIITSSGMSFVVEDPTFVIPTKHTYKAVFEINVGGGDTVAVNAQLTTLARFYNLHARNGVPETKLRTAAVIHGSGWTALLSDAAFAARFGGKPNPSRALTEELLRHGTQLVLCGQTAGARGVRREELLPGVKVAISAMSALQYFQSDGYAFIPW